MTEWDEGFSNFMGVIAIIVLATLFWNSLGTQGGTGVLGNTTTAINCGNEYVPVCGSDNLTYQNLCYATLHKVTPQYNGTCGMPSAQNTQAPNYNYVPAYQNQYNNTYPTLSGQYIGQ